MSTQIRALGFGGNDARSPTGRLINVLSNGNLVAIVRDTNETGETGGDKTGVEKLYAYLSTDQGATWILKTTLNLPAGITIANRLSSSLFPNDDIAVAICNNTANKIYYCKITVSTWTASAWETAVGRVGVDQFDMVVGDNGMVAIAFLTLLSVNGILYLAPAIAGRGTSGAWALDSSLGGATTFVKDVDRIKAGETVSIMYVGDGVYGVDNVSNFYCLYGYTGKTIDGGVSIWQAYLKADTGNLRWSGGSYGTWAQGEASKTSTRGVARVAKIFKSGPNDFTIGIIHSEVNRKMFAIRGTFSSSLASPNITIGPLTSTISGFTSAQIVDRGLAVSYGNDALMCSFATTDANGSFRNCVCTFSRTANQGYWGTKPYYFSGFDSYVYDIMGGSIRNTAAYSRHPILFVKRDGSAASANHFSRAQLTSVPLITKTITAPATGGTITVPTPSLSVSCYLQDLTTQSMFRLRWQFATDSAFANIAVDYTQPRSKRFDLDHSQTYTINDTYPTDQPVLTQGVWYARCCIVDDFGNNDAWSASASFTISHPSSAANLAPATGANISYPTSGQILFSWDFSDPWPGDAQTSRALALEDATSGAALFTLAKEANPATSIYVTAQAAWKDIPLRWRVQTWDKDDQSAGWTPYNTLEILSPPTVTIDTPVANAILSSAIPTIQFTPTALGGRTITKYIVTLTQGDQTIWSTAVTPQVSIASGTQVTVTADKPYLKNQQSYSVNVWIQDSAGLTTYASNGPVTFTTQWVTPPPPSNVSVDASLYNVEDSGYVKVTWDDTNRDPDFSNWSVWRKDDLVDDLGNIADPGDWNLVYEDFDTGSTYEYHDYLAPSGYFVSYRVTQTVVRFGDLVESNNTDSYSVYPLSDGYWLVEPQTADSDADAFKIALVTGDSYNDEYESAEYTVVGRGRHVDMGQHLGVKGSLDAQIRRTDNRNARQMKQRLLQIKQDARILWLRNPFGDIFRVSVGDMSITRIAGTGKSEFVDVNIPYSEVSI